MCRGELVESCIVDARRPRRQRRGRVASNAASRRRFEDRFQRLARQTFDAVFECATPKGDAEVGEALAEAVRPGAGYTPSDREAPEDWAHCVHPEDRALVAAHLQRVLSGHRDLCVFRVMTPAGGVRWFSTLTRPVYEATGRRIVHVYGLVRDYSAHTAASPLGREADLALCALLHFVRIPLSRNPPPWSHAPAQPT